MPSPSGRWVLHDRPGARPQPRDPVTSHGGEDRQSVSDRVGLFLCGDVMVGRGIDQNSSHPCDPELHEAFVCSAADYVRLAERANGSIPKPCGFPYIWASSLGHLGRVAPDIRVINLETSVTQSDDYTASKDIHYRMHPAKCRLPFCGEDRLLYAGEQPRPRLGVRRPVRDPRDARAGAHRRTGGR